METESHMEEEPCKHQHQILPNLPTDVSSLTANISGPVSDSRVEPSPQRKELMSIK